MSDNADSRMDAWAARLADLSRWVRVALVALFALIAAAFSTQVMVLLFGIGALYDETTALVSILVPVVVGVVLYGVGWWALVGFGSELAAGRRGLYFVLFGVLMTVALLFWLLISAIISALPPQIPI